MRPHSEPGSAGAFGSPHSDRTTHSLISEARAGDQHAWSELHERYRRILSILVRSSRPSAIRPRVGTEDLVQSTFLSAYRGLDGYEDRGPGSFLNWLKAILRNRIAERLRQHQAVKRDARREEALGDSSTTSAQTDPSPSEVASQAETGVMLIEAIATLPHDSRAVVIGYFFEEMTTKDMADALRTSESSVRRRLASALGVLRKSLGSSWPGEASV
jgi:RNA polymerase sigma-70 factor (ECF subfamily)